MTLVRLKNGIVYDPQNHVDGVARDLWIRDGCIVAGPATPDELPARTFDLSGLAVMPGGVDMHAHIAGPKVNAARRLRPEERTPYTKSNSFRSGTRASTPSSFVTGYLYAGLGYTTVFDAAIAPLAARATHAEFHDTPIIDKGFFVLTGNNHYAMEQIAANENARLRDFCAWLLHSTGGYALKIVNPGGVEFWKRGSTRLIHIDDTVLPFDITPRQIVQALAAAADELKLPHRVHIHCNQLGLPGNWETTLDSMRAVDGRRGHFTHIQFHSYGGGADDQNTFCSKTRELADYVNSHTNITVDVGQVLFSETTSMTGDGPIGYYLSKLTGRKWYNKELECEAGCGIVPITYKNKSFVHALQWAIGLEWYLLIQDPWQIAMSTDHPNGGSFLAYPEIIALLMSREYRREVLKTLPEMVKQRCSLAELDREYSLNEICIITRAGPARMLGLTRKGHLGIGADADITVYSQNADRKQMFELPRYVFKTGELIVENGELRHSSIGATQSSKPKYDEDALSHIKPWFEKNYSLQFKNYSESGARP